MKKTIISIAILGCILAAFFLLRPFVLKVIHADNVPALPNLTGQPAPVTDYINAVYAEAQRKPYADETIGKLALAFQANYFYKAAELCYTNAQRLNSADWRWHYYPALIKEELGDADGVIEHLKKVLEINDGVPHAWFKLGNAYLKQNSFEAAESAFKEVKNLKRFSFAPEIPDKGAFPLTVYARLNLGRVYLQQEKYTLASEALNALIQKNPRFGPAYRLLGQVYNSTGNTEAGKAAIIKAGDFESYIPPSDPMFNTLLLNSRHSDAILKHIDTAIKSENFAWADMLCNHMLSYDPNDAEALGKNIVLMLVKNKMDGLREKAKKLLNHHYDDDGKLIEIADTFYRRNQYELAFNYLRRAIAINPLAMDAQITYLKILVAAKSYDAAMAHCRKVLANDPENSALRTEYGRILALRGKEKEAREQFALAIKANANNEIPYILMGIMAEEKGNVNNALANYRESIKINPLNTKAIVQLGNYLLSLKRWKEADNLFIQALKDAPNDIDLLERRAWIQAACPDARIRNGEKALALAKRISLIRKDNHLQDVRCGITLAVAYAENENYSRAEQVLGNILRRAQETGQQKYIPQINEMTNLFIAKKPYRL